jgi:glycosyltransferase involved in cell wall biosynthesis
MPERFLTVLPVFNEVQYVQSVIDEVRRHSEHVLVVDDGSEDGTSRILQDRDDIQLVRHMENRGYGAALRSGFAFGVENGFEIVITIDCDGQHEPQRIPQLVAAARFADIVSGSRYLQAHPGDTVPPPERRRVNQVITAHLNEHLGLKLTDAFCGFKAYRTSALRQLHLTLDGYAMPLELWVQAAHLRLDIKELPVPLVYLDKNRSFGEALDNAATRLAYYRDVIGRSMAGCDNGGVLSAPERVECQ